MIKPIVLTIAGSDSGGGAGIQADIKTMTMNGVFGASAITSLTAQNTLGVTEIYDVTPEFLKAELEAVFTDLYPDAVKIGMVSSKALIEVIKSELVKNDSKNIVLDPVMVATSGSKLITDEAIDALIEELFPLASIITPNIPETEIILDRIGCSMKISNQNDMVNASRILSEQFDVSTLVKGGHLINDANDYLFDVSKMKGKWYRSKRINNSNTHGTGCTLSSAIASNLAKGMDHDSSVRLAKEYLTGALLAMLDLGKGDGPLDHGYLLNK